MTEPNPDADAHHDSEHLTAASHEPRVVQPLFLAPATGLEFNAVELDLAPVACLALRDTVFAFDSSFVMPQAGDVPVSSLLARLAPLRRRHRDEQGLLPLVAVFGHADPAGNDEYNKQLSGRRAKAVYGLLTHRVDLWQQLHDAPHGGDDWKANGAVETMRKALGVTAALPRDQLIQRYMALLLPTPLAKTEFLGRGADKGGKADFQGCGELNPVLLFSAEQAKAFAAEEQRPARNEANQPNRRVLLYLFPAAVVPAANLWPCPRASESSAGCRPRLFADAAQRRSNGVAQREFVKDGDTFACRFYDRIAAGSPCEQRAVGNLAVRVVPAVFTRAGNVIARLERVDGRPLPNVASLSLGGIDVPDVFTAPDGNIYFLPPRDAEDGLSVGLLENGQRLQLQSPVRYATEAKAAARALREQMVMLRQFATQVVAFWRASRKPEDDTRSAFCMVVGDAHLRFCTAVDRLAAGGGTVQPDRLALAANTVATAASPRDVDGEFAGFADEHGDALDAIGATLAPQRVDA